MTPQQAMEGCWKLDLWDDGAVTWAAPDIHGLFVLRDGVVAFMASRAMADGGRYLRHAYGHYLFGTGSWSYGYHHDLMLWETEQGIRTSHELPWKGMRSFQATVLPAQVRLHAEDGRYVLAFEEQRFFYYEDDRLIRAWTRL